MKLKTAVKKLDLEVVVEGNLEEKITGGYASDLLSNVMAQAKAGDLWFTIQGHQNVVAVGVLVEVAGIVIAEGVDVDEEAVSRAEENKISLFKSQQPIYELCGQLYQLRRD